MCVSRIGHYRRIALTCPSAFQPNIRESVPGWSSLLQIYLSFFIPVMFGLLVSLNIIVWAEVRINYVFIFGRLFVERSASPSSPLELDVRTVVDSRKYAEVSLYPDYPEDLTSNSPVSASCVPLDDTLLRFLLLVLRTGPHNPSKLVAYRMARASGADSRQSSPCVLSPFALVDSPQDRLALFQRFE